MDIIPSEEREIFFSEFKELILCFKTISCRFKAIKHFAFSIFYDLPKEQSQLFRLLFAPLLKGMKIENELHTCGSIVQLRAIPVERAQTIIRSFPI